MAELLGIDVGTTGLRALVIGQEGQVLASAVSDYPLDTPQPRWAEQDPQAWWKAAVIAVPQALERASDTLGRAAQVQAVGLSGQMHGVTLLDLAGEPLTPALLWCDSRADAECREITERVGASRLLELTANPALVGFSAPKLLWLRRHRPEAWDKARHFLLPKDFVRYRMTGTFATDVADASGTLLFDVARRCWSTAVLDALDLRQDLLPTVAESPTVTSFLTAGSAAALGLKSGTPVVAGGGDQACGAVGAGIVRPGVVSVTIGSSGVVFAYAAQPGRDDGGRVHTFCHAVPGAWHVMGVTQAAGLSLRWFRDQVLCTSDSYDDLVARAAGVPAGSEGLLYLPYLMGERTPHLDPLARGVFCGLTGAHGQGHLTRSILEGVAYSLRDCMEIFTLLGVSTGDVRMAGGGAQSPLWRQIVSDVLEQDVSTLAAAEGAAYGAALLAGVGAGVWPDVPTACDATVRVSKSASPTADSRTYAQRYPLYRELYDRLAPLMKALLVWCLLWWAAGPAAAVELQPVKSQVQRVVDTLSAVGQPLPAADVRALQTASDTNQVDHILARYTLFKVSINPEERVSVQRGLASPHLIQGGWTAFLVRVENQCGTTAHLRVSCPQAGLATAGSWDESPTPTRPRTPRPWLDVALLTDPPFDAELSGLALEYRIVQLATTETGQREATFGFDVGDGTQQLGSLGQVPVLFHCERSYPVKLSVEDENGRPCVSSFTIRDAVGRLYPLQSRRLAPDLFFQPQVYRRFGENVALPAGRYTVTFGRGPEYRTAESVLDVKGPVTFSKRLLRWIDPARLGWVSGDGHIHAAGCAHYNDPTQGVQPGDMERYIQGEDLKVGCVLTWGPCFDFQSQFFTGRPASVSTPQNVLRYDVEVSGFGSHVAGHIALLGLVREFFPGSVGVDGWPTLGLSVLRWAKAQGAVTGYAHSGWGLEVHGRQIPTPEVPRFDGIGANEYIVDVTQDVPDPTGYLVPSVDLLGVVDTPYVWELNVWYHALNVGFRTRLSGETDFPCITEERVGRGRSYVQVDRPDFDHWLAGLKAGRSYVSTGESHILNFRVDQQVVGVGDSELHLTAPGPVTVTASVAALLPVHPDIDLSRRPVGQRPFWSLERARLGHSRNVTLELVFNSHVIDSRRVTADGVLCPVSFHPTLTGSGWLALRILPSAHTNPIWVKVGAQDFPISASSARWCRTAVDVCWNSKRKSYTGADLGDAVIAYDHARAFYDDLVRRATAP